MVINDVEIAIYQHLQIKRYSLYQCNFFFLGRSKIQPSYYYAEQYAIKQEYGISFAAPINIRHLLF